MKKLIQPINIYIYQKIIMVGWINFFLKSELTLKLEFFPKKLSFFFNFFITEFDAGQNKNPLYTSFWKKKYIK